MSWASGDVSSSDGQQVKLIDTYMLLSVDLTAGVGTMALRRCDWVIEPVLCAIALTTNLVFFRLEFFRLTCNPLLPTFQRRSFSRSFLFVCYLHLCLVRMAGGGRLSTHALGNLSKRVRDRVLELLSIFLCSGPKTRTDRRGDECKCTDDAYDFLRPGTALVN